MPEATIYADVYIGPATKPTVQQIVDAMQVLGGVVVDKQAYGTAVEMPDKTAFVVMHSKDAGQAVYRSYNNADEALDAIY